MVQTHRIKTIAIVGCTAVGKSATAVALAKRFDGVLIGADSMQIYRGFDIGTGKLTKSECDGVEHRMIDIIDGDVEFSVGEFTDRATADIKSVAASGKLPIVVGGTGMYVHSLFCGRNFADAPKNDGLRMALKVMSHFFGGKTMHALLQNIDAASAERIAQNDVKRVIRALEIFALRGAPKSEIVTQEKPFDDLTIVLTLPRDILYERINARVHKMFDDGLIDEARSLMRYKNCGSMQALGYKQIAAAPDSPRAELEELVARKTRNYAKRQITYFNNMQLNKIFIDARDREAVFECVGEFTGR